MKTHKFILAILVVASMFMSGTSLFAQQRDDLHEESPYTEIHSVTAQSDTGRLVHLSSFRAGPSGGEIVVFNPVNNMMYVIGEFGLDMYVVDISNPSNPILAKTVDVGAMASETFQPYEITAVAVNVPRSLIGLGIQHEDFDANGWLLILDFDGNYVAHFPAGVGPDMVGFTPNGEYLLSANEGEPRYGFGYGTYDPEGSVTFVRIADGYARTVGFHAFDDRRDELVADGVILKVGVPPSRDLEPESLAFTGDSQRVFVSLQENNAIAVFDMTTYEFSGIYGLGIVDHSLPGNEIAIRTGDEIIIQNENVFSVRHPDGIFAINIGGTYYLLTANEGDSRVWEDYSDIHNVYVEEGVRVSALISELKDGLSNDNIYLQGSRSFSIFRADDMSLVFDSGSDFEKITARIFPEHFNANHTNNNMHGRTAARGPEPEYVVAMTIDSRVYAFVGLERIGGVFMYDITNPAQAFYVDYINVRDFSSPFDIALSGDLGAEKLYAIPAHLSPTGMPLVLVANEASGTITILGVTDGTTQAQAEVAVEAVVEPVAEPVAEQAPIPADTAPAATRTGTVVNCRFLNVRTRASAQANIVDVLSVGNVVTILESNTWNWHLIQFGEVSGWVYGGFVRVD